MASILWYSLASFISSYFTELCRSGGLPRLVGRWHGGGMGGRRRLVAEIWPARSRGLAVGLLQGSWAIGFLLSSAAYGMLVQHHWVARPVVARHSAGARSGVRAPLRQGTGNLGREPAPPARLSTARSAPLCSSVFKRGLIGTTVSACWCIGSASVAFDTISRLIAAHPRKDVDLLALLAAPPVATAVGLGAVLVSGGWGIVSDKFGRRAAMIVPALSGSWWRRSICSAPTAFGSSRALSS